MSNPEARMARAQIALAFFYGLVFVGMFLCLALFWQNLSKVEIGLTTMFATAAMNQSKDAASYFFARQRGANDPVSPPPAAAPAAAPPPPSTNG